MIQACSLLAVRWASVSKAGIELSSSRVAATMGASGFVSTPPGRGAVEVRPNAASWGG